MPNDRILSTLSLAQKAGQVASGEFSAEKAIKEDRAYLLIVAEDASDNTKKKMSNMTTFYEVPLYFYGNKESLGARIGKEYRSMVAITHPGFADSIKKQLDSMTKLQKDTE